MKGSVLEHKQHSKKSAKLIKGMVVEHKKKSCCCMADEGWVGNENTKNIFTSYEWLGGRE